MDSRGLNVQDKLQCNRDWTTEFKESFKSGLPAKYVIGSNTILEQEGSVAFAVHSIVQIGAS